MKKFPFVKQDGIKDCGVSSMAMIINYYHGNISIEKLRDMTKTTKLGTNAFNMVETFKQIGFEANGIKCNLNDINKDNIILPCIANVTINKSYKHYIVIYEINFKKKYLIIADPASKIKKISFLEFEEIWNNILLVCYPIRPIPIEKNIDFYSLFIKLFKLNKSMFIHILILSVFITIFSIGSSFFFQIMIDNYIKPINFIFILFLLFIIINLIKLISDFFRNKILIYINQKIDICLTLDSFKKIISLPYAYYRNRTTGEIVSRINDLGIIRNMIGKVALSLFVDLPLTLISLIFLLKINSTLFLIAVIILLLYILIIIVFKPFMNKDVNNLRNAHATNSSYMVECISGFETIKGLSIEDNIYYNYENKYVKELDYLMKYDNRSNIQYLLKALINNIGSLIIIYIGILLVYDNKITLSSLITFNSLLAYFLNPIRNIIDMDIDIINSKNALKRVLEMLNIEKENGLINNKIKNIEFKNMTYSYDNNKDILSNINLKISNNEKIMIIGNSGSGKSTLLKLLLKYYKVGRDMIYLNDVDINDYDLKCIKENICYISQNEILFTDTLYNNIILNRNIDNNQFLEITKLCEVSEIIKNNSLGYNLLIEENGFNLSGGEKQRVILSRSLLKPFNILIIDEGLNEMDINLERRILKRIFNKYKDKIIIIISHRLENMDLFDRVLEFSNSRLIKDYKYE